jgi:hypothetical protein
MSDALTADTPYGEQGNRFGPHGPLTVPSELHMAPQKVDRYTDLGYVTANPRPLMMTDVKFEAKKRTDVHWVQHIRGEDPSIGEEH